MVRYCKIHFLISFLLHFFFSEREKYWIMLKQKVETSLGQRQSLILMRNLIRIAISTITYQRKLFPEGYYKDRVMTGVTIKSLCPSDENAIALISWLEKGAFDALEKKILDKITLNLRGDAESEKYDFQIKYDKENEITGMSVTKDDDCPHSVSKAEIQKASNELVKKIVQLTQNLPRLTGEYRCSLQLHCRKGGSGEYNPTGFSLVNDIESDPLFAHPMGKIRTQYHELDVCAQLPINLFEEVGEDSREGPECGESDLLNIPNQALKKSFMKLEQANLKVLRLIANGAKEISKRNIRNELNLGVPVTNAIFANLREKKVIGPPEEIYSKTTGKKKFGKSPVLVNGDSICYLAKFNLTFPEVMPSRPNIQIPGRSKRAIAPSPRTRREISMIKQARQRSREEEGETRTRDWLPRVCNLK